MTEVPEDFAACYQSCTRKECMTKYGVGEYTIRKWAKCCGIEKEKKQFHLLRDLTLTDRQMEIVTGMMLGDGSITKKRPKQHCRFSVAHCVAQLGYLQWLHKELSPFCAEIGYWKTKSRGGSGRACGFKTFSLRCFTDMERKWYLRDENGNYVKSRNDTRIKVLPSDVKLTPLTLATWFYDDGSNSRSGVISLSTDCFSEQECLLLKEILFSDFSIKSYLVPQRNDQHAVVIRRGSYLDFLDIVRGQIQCDCMEYKLDTEWYSEPNYKISKADVGDIRKMRASGSSLRDVANKYGISIQYACCISKGRSSRVR